ncbi:hypothetical protein A2767_02095 [Candidatus Roizmanbacteria bacterium RIFCSPHIGHO2_01_FULL_35_10]|uniref:PIN domain-containing protein n=1 Tax=Candidatus Roizmanbacteria bacterium RIFCSPLOWO2_01_FULL_35_13 TaxID=1802055 RepID=A0A1F7I7K2_9BACT|nr:MAG: hypothetical protein A2767_02095 [Candidatus Roizmanbacteria bacterium RIFCSPHIGHO2_01_FULL_35_10]OGK39252.1 MAG: hypothetical protein A3A74_07515 [Candidatus Roizmanbacteria bacterium RIFCSPLOWO2_01_FULL_35_13]
MNYLLSIISNLEILPYNYDVSRLAGKIIRDTSRYVGFADAAIAATAVVNDAELFTLNKKDFQDIKGIHFFIL